MKIEPAVLEDALAIAEIHVLAWQAAYADILSADYLASPLVSIVAEGDLVVLSFVREGVDPKDASKTYTTTWFDMFRIESGKIAKHWDPA